MSKLKKFLDPGRDGMARDLGLLVLRVGLSFSLVYAHGYAKFMNLLAGKGANFPDPLGVGGTMSLGLASFGEFICAILVALGLFTRLASVPVIIVFVVAFFMIHGGDPFVEKEKAFLFLIGYVAVFLAGPGRFSLDQKFGRR